MHLITEMLWKLIAFVVVCLFVVTLPFALLALAVFHPHLSPADQDAMYFFRLMAIMFGGCAAWFWWIIIRIGIYAATKERIMIGAWSSFFVFFGTYFLEYLLLSHGVYALR
jgi:hypothetical protein